MLKTILFLYSQVIINMGKVHSTISKTFKVKFKGQGNGSADQSTFHTSVMT